MQSLSSHKDIFSVPSPGTFIWFLPFSVSQGTDFWGTDNRAVVSCVEEGHSSCFHFPRVQAWGPGVASGTLAGSASLPITRASPIFPRGCRWKRPQGCDRQTGCFSFHAGSEESPRWWLHLQFTVPMGGPHSRVHPWIKIVMWTYLQGRDRDVENGLWRQQGKERVGRVERVALTYIHYRV